MSVSVQSVAMVFAIAAATIFVAYKLYHKYIKFEPLEPTHMNVSSFPGVKRRGVDVFGILSALVTLVIGSPDDSRTRTSRPQRGSQPTYMPNLDGFTDRNHYRPKTTGPIGVKLN